MQKRRERIEQWRAARKPKQEDVTPVQAAPASREWTLEDEEDEDAENDVTATQNAENEDVDPLDAYMHVGAFCVFYWPRAGLFILCFRCICSLFCVVSTSASDLPGKTRLSALYTYTHTYIHT